MIRGYPRVWVKWAVGVREGSFPKQSVFIVFKAQLHKEPPLTRMYIYCEIIYYNDRRLTVLTKMLATLVIIYFGRYIFENMSFSQRHNTSSAGKTERTVITGRCDRLPSKGGGGRLPWRLHGPLL